jgi:two-component system cell cycle sensor histidine kinase/response regulator CckA
MTDERKTKRQLVAELEDMRRQIAELRGRLELQEGDSAAEQARAAQLLHALNEASLAMQKALTPQEIFTAVAEVFKELGFYCTVFLMDESQSRLLVKYLNYEVGALKAAEKLTGLKAVSFAIDVKATGIYREVVENERAVLVEDTEAHMRQVLPEPVKRFARQLARLLTIPRLIIAPLIADDRVIGALTVQSDDLVEDDVPSVTAFAHQMAAAWHKAQLLERAQQEIVERMRAEEALKESEMKLRLIFENAFDGISIYEELTDRGEHRLLDCNERYAEMAGRSKEELLEIGNTTLVQKKVSPVRSKQENLQLRREKRSYQGTFSWIRPDGQENIIEYSASPIRAGERDLSVGVDRDITERVRAEEAMRQASRLEATATLARGIAHDLNNLMVGVLGYADMLRMDLEGRKGELEMLDVISESARRASRLAQQMLAYARGGKYQPRAMNLNEIIQRVVSAQERAWTSKIHVVLDADPELWDTEADAAQMSEVVLNLLANAVEAIEGSGRITVATSNRVLDEREVAGLEPGRYVCLAVQDSGCGMSAEIQARIFEPFFTTKFQGRGMGLAAVYGIVENHGGHIAVQSEEGRGSTFQVYLPAICVADMESSGAASAAKANRDVALPALATVLVVEGDESVLKLTQRMLERMDCRTLAARSGQEAIGIARTFDGEIHLALLDMETPGVDGTETYPLLMEARPGIKVVLCSSYELNAKAQALLDAGASAFIQKPCQISAFEAEIRRALKG